MVYFSFFSFTQAKSLLHLSNDELIMRGLVYDEYNAHEDARQIYAKLFDATQVGAYLFKEAKSSLLGRTHIPESIERLKKWDISHPETLESKRLLIPLYLTNNQINLAKNEAENLIERSSMPLDLELASNPFLYSGEFKRALSLLRRVYETRPNEIILLRMADIMDEYTGERKRAIQLLETHRRMNITSNDVLAKLLVLYSKEKDIDGILETYKVLYEDNRDVKILAKILDAYAYKKDTLGAIKFLEKYQVENELLYELYKSKEMFSKALVIAQNEYKTTKDAKWLAEKAILLYENVDNKEDNATIKDVIKIFEKALKAGIDDSIYLNYYGYILIDKDIDIKKGIEIIKKALVQQPNNTYYLDSLAWGYYKLHACKKAYKLMRQVVDEEGLKEKEILEHWNTIGQCK